MVARGAAQRAAHDLSQAQARAAALGVREGAVTSSAKDRSGSLVGVLRTRRPRLRRVRLRT